MRTRYLYAVGAVVLLVGIVLVGVGFTQPNECRTTVALSVNDSAEQAGPVVEAGNLSPPMQQAVRTVVEDNETAFVEPSQYQDELANRTVQYEGTRYVVEGQQIQDCGGGRDDLFIFGGFWVAVVGTVLLALGGLYDYGSEFFPTEDDYR
ncbi:hypothetical protein [Haloarchaeobius sp. DFWS5]|uniref:hypothetical protein n=1 Tax=Haloarchaeobius sp. DFWS5 TaxID=3446114 RepID=UPI003EBB1AEC